MSRAQNEYKVLLGVGASSRCLMVDMARAPLSVQGIRKKHLQGVGYRATSGSGSSALGSYLRSTLPHTICKGALRQ